MRSKGQDRHPDSSSRAVSATSGAGSRCTRGSPRVVTPKVGWSCKRCSSLQQVQPPNICSTALTCAHDRGSRRPRSPRLQQRASQQPGPVHGARGDGARTPGRPPAAQPQPRGPRPGPAPKPRPGPHAPSASGKCRRSPPTRRLLASAAAARELQLPAGRAAAAVLRCWC